ncbi:MAG: aminopeptidase [Spirochaetaceae bacterium]|jgi:predicted aminopeptidase|nr:aminopeptidase [Spirochaetaceae bacterium]
MYAVPAGAGMLITLLMMVLFSGCYTLTQGAALFGYLNKAVPLDRLLEDSAEPENRRFAERILDIRRFAIEELGLKESSNYTKYVDIDRDYLAAVVSATAPDSFTRHEWRFPIVGKVPYKGFFDPKDARREGEKLKKQGLDVWIRQVDAFSTLGWFSDPLYSYMRNYPVYRLADLIIHETLHATVYLKGQSQFNEELAEFVGTEGSRLYMEKTFGADSEEYRQMLDASADSGAYLGFIQGLIAELDAVYTQPLSPAEKLEQKERIIRNAQSRFAAEYETLFRSDNYRGFSRLPVNNAYLELFRLYYAGGDYLRKLYEDAGGDLSGFIDAAKTLTPKDDPRAGLESALRRKFLF